jgi:HAD superfamily hydrolase (TIGR01509 family)
MIKAIIFDVDGTLIDSVDLHARAWQETLKHFGLEIPFADVRSQIGKGGDQLLPVFFNAAELEQKGEAIEKHRSKLFKEHYLSRVRSFPQVRIIFERLLKDGKQIVLASSAKKEEVERYKEIAQIADLIKAETSSDDVEKSKPHPDIFIAALEELKGVSPDEAIVVGDTPYDAIAASKTGLETIGLLCGRFPEADLSTAGCVAIFQDPADLLAWYETKQPARYAQLHKRLLST